MEKSYPAYEKTLFHRIIEQEGFIGNFDYIL